jgi:hypothetical protein
MTTLELPKTVELTAPTEGGGYVCASCGKEHKRVTQLIDQAWPTWALVPWAAKLSVEGTLAFIAAHEQDYYTAEGVMAWLKDQGLDSDSQKKAGGDRGTALHRALETYATTGEFASVSDFDPEVRPYWAQLSTFLMDYEPQFEVSEIMLANCELDYAGTSDGIAVITKQPPRKNRGYDLTGKRVMFDLKSNRDGRVHPPAHLYQLAAYRLAWDVGGGSPLDHEIVVAVGTESYQVCVNYYEPDSFRKLVEFVADQERQKSLNPNGRKNK